MQSHLNSGCLLQSTFILSAKEAHFLFFIGLKSPRGIVVHLLPKTCRRDLLYVRYDEGSTKNVFN